MLLERYIREVLFEDQIKLLSEKLGVVCQIGLPAEVAEYIAILAFGSNIVFSTEDKFTYYLVRSTFGRVYAFVSAKRARDELFDDPDYKAARQVVLYTASV